MRLAKEMEGGEHALGCARKWVTDKGWAAEDYSVRLSDPQTCPPHCIRSPIDRSMNSKID